MLLRTEILSLLVFIVFCFSCVFTIPISNGRSQEIMEHMREIPQWHCLRYRKFDLVKRCRNYRVGLKKKKCVSCGKQKKLDNAI